MGLDQYLYRVVDPDKPVIDDIYADGGIYDQAIKSFGPIDYTTDDANPASYAAFKRHLSTYTNLLEVAYWRKFNALHLWMEHNANNGVESNGDDIPVSLEQLAGLLTTCERVATDPSTGPDVLPTGSRFFFGSTEYDDYYVSDCLETANTLRRLLGEEMAWVAAGNRTRPFFYSSSW